LPNCSHPLKVMRGLRAKYNGWVSMPSMLVGV
jgi:hypothetical protein